MLPAFRGSRFEDRASWPLSSEYGTYKTVKDQLSSLVSGSALCKAVGIPERLGQDPGSRSATHRCRANLKQIRQSRPDSGLGLSNLQCERL